MRLSAMRFKTFVWPHNPAKLRMDYAREVRELIVPYQSSVLQDLGQRRRVVWGTGEFYGETAYSDFIRLAPIFRDGGSGLLVLPGFDPMTAYFSKLELTQDPTPDCVQYSFTFLEQQSMKYAVKSGASRCTAASGDNLWTIASRFGTTLESLLALNPGIRNPFDVRAGQTIRLQ